MDATFLKRHCAVVKDLIHLHINRVEGAFLSSQTTTHMHGHHEATMGLAGVSLGREIRALALSHTASVRRGTA